MRRPRRPPRGPGNRQGPQERRSYRPDEQSSGPPRHERSPNQPAIRNAISEVKHIASELKVVLEDLQRVLDLLQRVEQQKNATDEEIEELRYQLKELQQQRERIHHPRGAGA